MREVTIGEEIRIRCVETPDGSCDKCILSSIITEGAIHCRALCSANDRTDGKNVHFELI